MNIIDRGSLNLRKLKIIYSVLKEFAWGFNFYTSERSLKELGAEIEKLEIILSRLKKIFNSQEFFKEWGCYDETQKVDFSEDEVKVMIKALDKIFDYLDDDDIDTRVGYSPYEIKETRETMENFLALTLF